MLEATERSDAGDIAALQDDVNAAEAEAAAGGGAPRPLLLPPANPDPASLSDAPDWDSMGPLVLPPPLHLSRDLPDAIAAAEQAARDAEEARWIPIIERERGAAARRIVEARTAGAAALKQLESELNESLSASHAAELAAVEARAAAAAGEAAAWEERVAAARRQQGAAVVRVDGGAAAGRPAASIGACGGRC